MAYQNIPKKIHFFTVVVNQVVKPSEKRYLRVRLTKLGSGFQKENGIFKNERFDTRRWKDLGSSKERDNFWHAYFITASARQDEASADFGEKYFRIRYSKKATAKSVIVRNNFWRRFWVKRKQLRFGYALPGEILKPQR